MVSPAELVDAVGLERVALHAVEVKLSSRIAALEIVNMTAQTKGLATVEGVSMTVGVLERRIASLESTIAILSDGIKTLRQREADRPETSAAW